MLSKLAGEKLIWTRVGETVSPELNRTLVIAMPDQQDVVGSDAPIDRAVTNPEIVGKIQAADTFRKHPLARWVHRIKRYRLQGDCAMRLINLAAGIFTIALAGYIGVTTETPAKGASQPIPHARSNQPTVQPAGQSSSQQNVPQDQGQGPLKVQTNVVNVFATVRNKQHGIVTDLTKDDFKITEDGVDQKVEFFQKEVNMPITLGMLIDTSASMDRMIDAEHDAASRFLREVMRPKDETMVITFDFDVDLVADFTQDTSVLASAIRSTRVNSFGGGGGVTPGPIPQGNAGGTDLYDAVYLACHDQLATEAGRKGMIILTDAEDTGSKLKMQDAIEAAQRSDAVIHVLLISDRMATFGTGLGVAHRMAEDTGGRVIDVHHEKSLENAFDELSEELRSQYVLGYYPTNVKRDGVFRKIQVTVTRPDVKILARKGYYAPFK
jgi:VWFA-related protein